MKQIIVDHLRRKWWIIVPLLFVDVFFMRVFATTAHHVNVMLIWLPLLLGPSLLSHDQQRGLTRVLMALPVTAKQIGQAWWIATVGVPSLLLAAAAALSAIVPLDVGQARLLFLICLMQVLLLGSLFCPLSFAAAGDRSSLHEKARGWLFAALWVAGILLMFGFSWSNPFTAGIFVAAGSVLTISGWFHAEQRVLRRGAFHPDDRLIRLKSAQNKAPDGYGGLPFLWQSLLIPLGWLGLAFIVGLVLTGMFRGLPFHFPPQVVEVNVILFSPISFLFVYAFVVVPVVTQLRLLRTLPISASILAATLVLIPSGSVIFFGFVFAALGGGHLVLGSLLTAAAVAVFAPLFVWRGWGAATFLPVFLLVILSAITFPILFLFFELTDGPRIWTVPFSIIVIFLSWEITRRVLRSSSQAYHCNLAVANDSGGMRWS